MPHSLLAKLGIPELATKWPSEVLRLGELVGGLTPSAAQHLGLAPGTAVAQGGADAFVGMLGLGVVAPGQMALLTGAGGGRGAGARAGWLAMGQVKCFLSWRTGMRKLLTRRGVGSDPCRVRKGPCA